ncbi:MAG: ABC transporter ATP-binding protein [Desulfatiglandales bacterium]
MKLVVEGLSKSYQRDGTRVPVLEGLSFEVNQGEFVSIVGPSGCGKSTLLRCIARLEGADEGLVSYQGNGDSRRPLCSVVFQELALFPWRSALKNITFGLEELRIPKRERERIGREYLEMMRLGGFESFRPKELSGGMKQRVAIARAMAVEPYLLLMDEPMASLDAITAQRLQLDLMEIISQKGQSVLYVTHNIPEAVFLSDRVIVMTERPGRIKEEVRITESRPRDLAFKLSSKFVGYLERLWKLLS